MSEGQPPEGDKGGCCGCIGLIAVVLVILYFVGSAMGGSSNNDNSNTGGGGGGGDPQWVFQDTDTCPDGTPPLAQFDPDSNQIVVSCN